MRTCLMISLVAAGLCQAQQRNAPIADVLAVSSNTTPSINNVNPMESVEALRAKIPDYAQHPEAWKSNMLALARAYAAQGKFQEAAQIYEQFLSKEPKHPRAIRGLGHCYAFMQRYPAAIEQYQKAWSLGDEQALLALGGMYFIELHDDVHLLSLVPDLKRLRKDFDRLDPDQKHELVNLLLVCSVKASPKDRQFFLHSIEGLSDSFFLERMDTAQLAFLAFKEFGFQERVRTLLQGLLPELMKLRKEFEKLDSEKKHETIKLLLAYSLEASPKDKQVFLQTIEGLTDPFILERQDTAQLAIIGFKEFGFEERAKTLESKLLKEGNTQPKQ